MTDGATPGRSRPLQIFVSYRPQDSSAYAGRLFDDLVERFGEKRVFVDVDGIDAGSDFKDVIVDTIERADVLVAVVGPMWLSATDDRGRRRLDDADDYVRMEIELALHVGTAGDSGPGAGCLPALTTRKARPRQGGGRTGLPDRRSPR